MTEKFVQTLHYVDVICGLLFIFETAIRLHALRRKFLLQFWNFYDAVAVILLISGKSSFKSTLTLSSVVFVIWISLFIQNLQL